MKNKIIKIAAIVFSLSMQAQEPVKLSSDQFVFVEGPVWDGTDLIYFTDIPESKVYKYSVSKNTFSLAFEDSKRANGLMFADTSHLLVCQGETGSIVKREVDGSFVELVVSDFNGESFNGPNDLVIDKKGGVYFTDPSFEGKNQPETGLYYVTSDSVVTKQDSFGETNPNGVILSPDGKKLYVDNTSNKNIYRYDVDAKTGKLSNRKIFGELPDDSSNTGADGLSVDKKGNLYVTAKKYIYVFNGKKLAPKHSISFPELVTNCTFGGVEKDVLYATAGKNLYKVSLKCTTGVRHPFDLK